MGCTNQRTSLGSSNASGANLSGSLGGNGTIVFSNAHKRREMANSITVSNRKAPEAKVFSDVDPNQWIPWITRIPAFEDLEQESIVELCAMFEKVLYAEGGQIVREGGVGDSFYIVITGAVQVCLCLNKRYFCYNINYLQ